MKAVLSRVAFAGDSAALEPPFDGAVAVGLTDSGDRFVVLWREEAPPAPSTVAGETEQFAAVAAQKEPGWLARLLQRAADIFEKE